MSCALVSEVELKTIDEAQTDDDWIIAIEEEIHEFTVNFVWTLVPNPESKSIIGTRWIFINKLEEQGKVVRKKSRSVAQGYNQ